MKITFDEAQSDLSHTQIDIQRLRSIVYNLEKFIYESGGENRSFLRGDLVKYEGLLKHAETLESKIQTHISKLYETDGKL